MDWALSILHLSESSCSDEYSFLVCNVFLTYLTGMICNFFPCISVIVLLISSQAMHFKFSTVETPVKEPIRA